MLIFPDRLWQGRTGYVFLARCLSFVLMFLQMEFRNTGRISVVNE
jgi:hypothetical protein